MVPGIYLIRVLRDGGFGGYTIHPQLKATTASNDQEPNDSRSQAQKIAADSASTGLLGYTDGMARNTDDWFQIDISSPGTLQVYVEGEG